MLQKTRTFAAIVAAAALCPLPVRSQATAEPLVRMPIRNGVITLKVADYEAARRQLAQTAAQFGAELKDANTEVNTKGARHGWTRLILPQDRLPGAIAAVKSFGKLYAERVETNDATSESEDAERRANLLREHRQSLMGLLSASRRLRGGDILFVQDRLFRAAVDESELRQREIDLARSAQKSSLLVVMFEPGAAPAAESNLIGLGHWFSVSVGRAHAAMNHDLARAVTATAYVTVFAWLWVPLAIAGIIFERRTRAIASFLKAIKRTLSAIPTRRATPPASPA
jgi:hypothetical protein